MVTTAVVGAGAAALSLALMLDDDVVIFEKDTAPGGLCRSSVVDGFTFDRGPHILGGIPDAVAWVLEHTPDVDFVLGETSNRGILEGALVPHPFVDAQVGREYMAKMWKIDPARLSASSLGVQHGRKPGGVPQFRYPRCGGYEAITACWSALLHERIVYGSSIDSEEEFAQRAAAEGFDRVVWTAPRSGDGRLRYNTLITVTAGFCGAPPPHTALYL